MNGKQIDPRPVVAGQWVLESKLEVFHADAFASPEDGVDRLRGNVEDGWGVIEIPHERRRDGNDISGNRVDDRSLRDKPVVAMHGKRGHFIGRRIKGMTRIMSPTVIPAVESSVKVVEPFS